MRAGGKLFLLLITLMMPSLASAADKVALTSAVFVEKQTVDSDGRAHIALQTPKVVTPGDRLVFILRYQNEGIAPARQFTVTNPLPSAVSYEGTADDAALVSVDGGQNWGSLPTLRVKEDDGRWRSARPDEVTHIRWTLAQPLQAGATGKLSFRGTVR